MFLFAACLILLCCLLYFSSLKMEVTFLCEKSVDFQQTTRVIFKTTELFTATAVRTSYRKIKTSQRLAGV
jgi:hypothetical protein